MCKPIYSEKTNIVFKSKKYISLYTLLFNLTNSNINSLIAEFFVKMLKIDANKGFCLVV